MINQIQEATNQFPPFPNEDVEDVSALIYDSVRGVTKAPLRDALHEDPLQQADQEQAEQVWEKMLRPKTKRQGAQEYFTITTKEDT